MSIFAIADLHLSFSTPEKSMEVFGWNAYQEKIEKNWQKNVDKGDLVLIPGDISWAMRFEQALKDLEWLDSLSGTKLIVKGNHDYWWPATSKLKDLPPSIKALHNSAFDWGDVSIGGARLWSTPEYNFDDCGPQEKTSKEDEKIYERELLRLRKSLSEMNKNAKTRIAMTHFPPIGASLQPSKASLLFEEFNIHISVFGHLHNLLKKVPFGEKNGIRYILSSADYLDFVPIKIV